MVLFSPIFLRIVDNVYVIVYIFVKMREIMNVTTFRKDIFKRVSLL